MVEVVRGDGLAIPESHDREFSVQGVCDSCIFVLLGPQQGPQHSFRGLFATR